jgi:hypothetical protein
VLWQGEISFDRNEHGLLIYLEDATFLLNSHHEELVKQWINTLLQDLELIPASSATVVFDVQDCVLELSACRVADSVAIDVLFESIGGYYKYNRAVVIETSDLREILEALSE